MQILQPDFPAILHTPAVSQPDTRERRSSSLAYLAVRGWMHVMALVIIVLAACCRPDESP